MARGDAEPRGIGGSKGPMLSTMTLDWPHPRPRVLRQRKRLILQPYEVRIDGSHRGAFEDQVDAVHSANIAQHEHPSAIISVTDRSTGRLVVELAPQANTARRNGSDCSE